MSNPKGSVSLTILLAHSPLHPVPAFFFLSIRRYNKRPYGDSTLGSPSYSTLVCIHLRFILSYVLPLTTSLGLVSPGLRWLVALIWVAIFLAWLWLLCSTR